MPPQLKLAPRPSSPVAVLIDQRISATIKSRIPAEHRHAAALYLATESVENLWTAWDMLGGRRSEYAGFVFDSLRELGTWVMIDGQPALSPYCRRWSPPKPRRSRRGRCGKVGHGTLVVSVDPDNLRGPIEHLPERATVEMCADCWDDLHGRKIDQPCRFFTCTNGQPGLD